MIPISRKLKDADDVKMKFSEIYYLLSQKSTKQLGESLIDRFKGKSLIFFGNIKVFD